jgi:hypothetical protein
MLTELHGFAIRIVVRADEKLPALVELQTAIHEFAVSLIALWPRS